MTKNYYYREIADLYMADLNDLFENKLKENFEAWIRYWFKFKKTKYVIKNEDSQQWELLDYGKPEISSKKDIEKCQETPYKIDRENKRLLYGEMVVGGILEIYRVVFNRKYIFEGIEEITNESPYKHLLYILPRTKTKVDKEITEVVSKMVEKKITPIDVYPNNYYCYGTQEEENDYCYIDENKIVYSIKPIFKTLTGGYLDKGNIQGIIQTAIGELNDNNELQKYDSLSLVHTVKYYSDITC